MDHRALADDLLATPGPLPGSVAPRFDGRGIAALGPTLLRAFGVEHHHPTPRCCRPHCSMAPSW